MLIDQWIRKCLRKKSYSSKAEANRVAEHQMGGNHRLTLHVYHCPQCKKYHLTSRNDRRTR